MLTDDGIGQLAHGRQGYIQRWCYFVCCTEEIENDRNWNYGL